MLTSASVVATALAGLAGGAVAAPGVGAVGAGTASVDWHPMGRSDTRPAPSEREPKPRRDRSPERRRYVTMSSKESSSHMGSE
jgi:hypothetical protein